MRKVIEAEANQIEPESARKLKLASGPRPGRSPLHVRSPISTDPAVPRRKLSATPTGPVCRPATSTTVAAHFSRISPACIAPSPANLRCPWPAARRCPAMSALPGSSDGAAYMSVRYWVEVSDYLAGAVRGVGLAAQIRRAH